MVTMIMRRFSMNRKAWKSRSLIFSDSMTAVGCVMKGRSSHYPLLRQCRILAGLALGLQLVPNLRYLESERNNSDGPS